MADFNYDDYNISDNGDGTFTLTPKTPTINIPDLLTEYREIRDTGLALLAQRNDINARLLELQARRDELRQLLIDAGYLNPDDDQ